MKTRKILSLALALVMVLALFPVTAGAVDHPTSGVCGATGNENDVTWTLEPNGAKVTDEYTGEEKDAYTLTIAGNGPMQNVSYMVDTSGLWFDYCDQITKIVVSDGVTSIGANSFGRGDPYVFNDLPNLTEVTIADTVTKIGEYAFYNASLTVFQIPNNLEEMPANALPAAVTEYKMEVGNSHFMVDDGVLYAKNYRNVWEGETYAQALMSYPSKADLIGYTVLTGTTAILSGAFSDSKLETVTLNSDLQTIGTEAFRGCANLEKISIPSGVSKIEPGTFDGCTSLMEVNLPSSLTSVDLTAFWNCDALSKAIIPASVTTVTCGFSGPDGTIISEDHFDVYFLGDAPAEFPSGIEMVGGGNEKLLHTNIYYPVSAAGWAELIEGFGEDEMVAFHSYELPDDPQPTTKELTKSMFTVDTAEVTYTGSPITKTVTGKDGDKDLALDTDYTVTYADNTNVGTAKLTIAGKGNYTGTLEYTFTIKAKPTGGNTGGGSTGGGSSSGGGSTGGGSTKPTEPENPPVEPETPATPASEKFGDVAKDSWYEAGVTYVTDKGLFQGVSEGVFAPSTNMTRAMLMTVLARLDGQETAGGATWYAKAMDWAKEQGISDGSAPDGNVTREQLVTMLYRYAKPEKAEGGLDQFADGGSVSAWAKEAMEWAVANGIVTGKGGARLDPQGTATRAEVATIIQRFAGKTEQ